MSLTLEQEFEDYVFKHKSAVVLGCLIKYYQDKKDTGVNIPEFLDSTPEQKAKEHYYNLLGNNDEFNVIYNKCWERIGELLP